jgi:hypothetical protein
MQLNRSVMLALLGVYLNIVAFGFEYGIINHTVWLPLVNWLINPSLYPDDPVPKASALNPTFFWQAVAYASAWIETLHVIFITFILTKVLFFGALIRLVGKSLDNHWLVACIICSIALSPLLNSSTPFGSSDILNSVQTQTSLAIALLLWVGCLLVEKRWLLTGVVLGLSIYVQVQFAMFTMFAFVGFALLDWRQHKREVLSAALSMVIVGLPWLVLSQGTLVGPFPENYVETLLMLAPGHFILRNHMADVLQGVGILTATVCMVALAVTRGIPRDHRLEWLAGFFVIPVLLGALIGEAFPFPSLVRLAFLRADSFLMLYSMVLIQVYGGRILLSTQIRSPAAALLLGTLALLFPLFFPLSHGLQLILLVLLSAFQVIHPGAVFMLSIGLTVARLLGLTWIPGRAAALVAVVSGFFLARRLCLLWMPGKLAAFTAVVSSFFVYPEGVASMGTNQCRLALGICGLVLIIAIPGAIRSTSRLWNPMVAPDPLTASWHEIQRWAKSNTPQDAKFLIPPLPDGFRVFSERTSWVDWKDGNAMFTLPEYAAEWRRRLDAIGIRLVVGREDYAGKIQQYKEQSWERLLTVAREHNLNYLIQYGEVPYPVTPVFTNERFSVYKAVN